ncbi:hypothetical protein Tco_1351085, partial [Tanacetum coccineum]
MIGVPKESIYKMQTITDYTKFLSYDVVRRKWCGSSEERAWKGRTEFLQVLAFKKTLSYSGFSKFRFTYLVVIVEKSEYFCIDSDATAKLRNLKVPSQCLLKEALQFGTAAIQPAEVRAMARQTLCQAVLLLQK